MEEKRTRGTRDIKRSLSTRGILVYTGIPICALAVTCGPSHASGTGDLALEFCDERVEE